MTEHYKENKAVSKDLENEAIKPLSPKREKHAMNLKTYDSEEVKAVLAEHFLELDKQEEAVQRKFSLLPKKYNSRPIRNARDVALLLKEKVEQLGNQTNLGKPAQSDSTAKDSIAGTNDSPSETKIEGLILAEAAKLLLVKAKQLEANGTLHLARMYFHIVLSEGEKSITEPERQYARDRIENIDRATALKLKSDSILKKESATHGENTENMQLFSRQSENVLVVELVFFNNSSPSLIFYEKKNTPISSLYVKISRRTSTPITHFLLSHAPGQHLPQTSSLPIHAILATTTRTSLFLHFITSKDPSFSTLLPCEERQLENNDKSDLEGELEEWKEKVLSERRERELLEEECSRLRQELATLEKICAIEKAKDLEIKKLQYDLAKTHEFEFLVFRFRSFEFGSMSNFQLDLLLGEVAKLLLHKSAQVELSGNLELMKAYCHVILSEGRGSIGDEDRVRALSFISNINKAQEAARKKEIEQCVHKIQVELENIEKQTSTQMNEEREDLKKQREELEMEKRRLSTHQQEVAKRERKLRVFEEKYKQWTKRLEATEIVENGTKEGQQLLLVVQETKEEVEFLRRDLQDKVDQADMVRKKLEVSKKELKKKIKYLEKYLDLVENQGLLPEAVQFRNLLNATKHLSSSLFSSKVKCFISYAWHKDTTDNAALQDIVENQRDLKKAGILVMLDIHNMEGEINKYMLDGIQQSDRVLLICTPRLKERAEEQSTTLNNLQKEYYAALERQKHDHKFIIPLVLSGDRDTSIAKDLPNILSMDFTDPKNYCENMISLSPKGLIPTILGLEHNKVYLRLVQGYHAHLELLAKK